MNKRMREILALIDEKMNAAKDFKDGNENKINELRSYLARHMVPNPHAGEPGSKGRPQGRYRLDHTRLVRWAFIS